MKNLSCLFTLTALSSLILLSGCKEESEIIFSHAKHIERGLKDCNMCHSYEEDLKPKWPDMQKCLLCHRKDYNEEDLNTCLKCHTNPSIKAKIKHKIPKRYKDLKFTHEVHLENDIECLKCHKGIEESESITEDLIPVMLDTCIPCHKERGSEATECLVCHKGINGNRMPLYHEDKWVNHEDFRWIQKHGNEFYYNKDYCGRCHEDLNWCINCHQDQKPENHNNTWRLKTHGFAASWERKKCTVCHQEDFCVRCHNDTTPVSHTASWGGTNTGNRHCVNCHFPVSMVTCTVCHPNPAHASAINSPHPPFVGNCTQSGCHPTGRVGEPPHTNLGLSCTVCHLQ